VIAIPFLFTYVLLFSQGYEYRERHRIGSRGSRRKCIIGCVHARESQTGREDRDLWDR
jgi:hypothetical protein